MANTYLHLNNLIFKNKFFGYLKHRKQVKALENLSKADIFNHEPHLGLIKLSLKQGFLDPQETKFLDFLLARYAIDWKLWAYKSPWTKKEMKKRQKVRKDKQETEQLEFNFKKNLDKQAAKVPLHLIFNQNIYSGINR